MSDTVSIQKRLQQLKKLQADLPEVMYNASKNATLRAIEVATETTPPLEGSPRGANTTTGHLQQSWAKVSVKEPMGGALSGGSQYTTWLKNDEEYASYVNNGHRLSRHFVPGLYIDNKGLIAKRLDGKGGLVVGTKTKFVKGAFMAEKAKKAYQKAIEDILDKEIEEMMNK